MLRPRLEDLKILSDREVSLLEQHHQLLKKWSPKINLVSAQTLTDPFEAHYLDSIYITDFAEKYRGNRSVLDIGSGAGFPGIVFAIRFPEVSVRLFERIVKKRSFLADVVSRLNLKNVQVEGEFPNSGNLGLILGRAVMPPPELLKFFVRTCEIGSAIVVSSALPVQEAIAGTRLVSRSEYELPTSGKRSLAAFERQE